MGQSEGTPRLMPTRLPAVRAAAALEWRVLALEKAPASLCRTIRENAGLTVAELARRLEVWERAVRVVEEGKAKTMALDTFVRWVEACGGNVIVEQGKR